MVRAFVLSPGVIVRRRYSPFWHSWGVRIPEKILPGYSFICYRSMLLARLLLVY
jgi:hypothetical protein